MDLFGTAGIRGPVEDVLTPELALAVGRAAGAEADEFVLGRDGRVTGEGLADAVAAGLASAGASVRRVGVVPTPALAFASRGRHGVMLTASHNPPADNGVKLFADGREYAEAAERRIAERVEDVRAGGAQPVDWRAWGDGERESVLPAYRRAVGSYATEFGADADSLTVAVDCGGGTAGLATPQVLTDLGASVRALDANVDGHLSARESKPTAESLAALRAFVADGGADLGVGHDGDADRIVLVDGDGEVVHEDTVLAILAERFVARSDAADPVVVTTPNASARIDDRVRAAGGRFERVRLGALHEGVAAAHEAGGAGTEVVFAAEPWKHVHPGLGGWIDAVASAAVLTRLVASGGLDALVAPVDERPYRKANVPCPDGVKPAVMDRLAEALPEAFPAADADHQYGVRLEFPDGEWVLVRPSGTEPYVRIYAESEDVEELLADVEDRVAAAVEAASEE